MNLNTYPAFVPECRSLLKKHLSKELFERLSKRVTANGYSFAQAIHSGVINQDSRIGVYAGDEETYRLFSDLFNPIIEDYHGFGPTDKHCSCFDVTSLDNLDPDPEGNYILSTRIRVGRNLDAMPLGPGLTKEQRTQVSDIIVTALGALDGDLAGRYFSLDSISESDRRQLVEDHFLFKSGDRFLDAAGLNRDWPSGRGIYHNSEKTFLVWVNEEDQMRIISMEQGGDIGSVFKRLVYALESLNRKLEFLYDSRLGYLTSCPTNLGTAMRASVHIRLPKLAENISVLSQLADRFNLQIRGVHGEHTESVGGVYDISNRRRLGITEAECINDLSQGVAAIIDREKSL